MSKMSSGGGKAYSVRSFNVKKEKHVGSITTNKSEKSNRTMQDKINKSIR